MHRLFFLRFYILCLTIFALSSLEAINTRSNYQDPLPITMVAFKNDIISLHQLQSEKIIRDLAPLINHCKIFINGQLIRKGYLAHVPIVNNKCTITIAARLDFFHPIFNLHPFIKLLGRFIQSHLIFYYEIHPQDLIAVDGHESHIDVSNIIIDLVDKYDLWEGSSQIPAYKTEFYPADCITKITIIDP